MSDEHIVTPWRMDFHSPMCDGDGIRFEYDGAEGTGGQSTVGIHVLHLVGDSCDVTHDYICQTPDLEGLVDYLEGVLNNIRQLQRAEVRRKEGL